MNRILKRTTTIIIVLLLSTGFTETMPLVCPRETVGENKDRE